VTVTNHTSTRNTCELKVALIDQDGKTVMGSSYVTIPTSCQGRHLLKTPDSQRLWMSQFPHWTRRTQWWKAQRG
jgi:hypothetical protein